jgi:signal transduction histidine kinase
LAIRPNIAQQLAVSISTRRRWVVLAMLAALHVALVSTPGGDFQRVWLLVHFGLFLLWQPFIAGERELRIFSAALLLIITIVTISFLAGWMIVMWLLVLLGIFGGRVFTLHAAPRNRFYLVAFGYVLAVLLLWAVPALILGPREVPEPVAYFARTFLPLVLALLAVLKLPREGGEAQVFDFFYAVLVFQLGLVLVLGAIVLMRLTGESYMPSVALTALGFGIALFVLAVLWNPMGGYGGLRTYFSRYLLSVGMPFELWMRRVAELAETESDSQRFLEQALNAVAEFPWIRGAAWRSDDGEGRVGAESEHASRFAYLGLEIEFFTAVSLSPALLLHMRLLARVIAEFYEGKRREQTLRRNAYLQAVHETGARLTHDVKNLLQSLYALTSMAPSDPADGYGALLQRQLPALAKRLATTLEKLRAPEIRTSELAVGAQQWWDDLERRLGAEPIRLRGECKAAIEVPASLFDSFVENALENARAKAAREPGIEIFVGFICTASHVEVRVCDTGSAVEAGVARHLFREPVERDDGLGIGLYHAARQAAAAGFSVELASNRDGEVCFALVRGAPSA